jgi:hypothetical protein
MKKILFVIFSALVFYLFLSPSKVSAQGSCTCNMATVAHGTLACRVASNNCDSGYTAICSAGTQQCNGSASSCTCASTTNCVAHSGSCNHTLPCCTTGDSCSTNNICEGGTISAPSPLCGGGVSTAIGCIPIFSQNDFLAFILRWAVGIGGGIAFLLMIYAGFMIMTAAGNPERLKAGQELLTSAISGLILLIFSVFILKFIGVDILGLCNLGFKVVGSCP